MPGHFTFYSEKIENGIAYFSEQETKHAILVLRFQLNDHVEFSDGFGNYYKGQIIEIQKKTFLAEIKSVEQYPQKDFTISVGILKSSDRMEWLVEKCSELGVKKIVFLKSQNGERSKINIEKLRKTAIAAMKQSHGSWLMEIIEMEFSKAIVVPQKNKYIAYCDHDFGISIPIHFLEDSIVFIGPEGDFSKTEIEIAKKNGFQVIGLGSKILRTETAAIVCASWALN